MLESGFLNAGPNKYVSVLKALNDAWYATLTI